ncbi:MAG: hypothetical protein HY882_07055 [Deltaproteobacteria bacterium]|nr:hypothetical protein [Deltaproteobacteria bacterium]
MDNMEPLEESLGKKAPSSKSLNELMNLLMKLNAKLREKISPANRKKENGPEKMDVVIIILSSQAEKARSAKTSRPGKTDPMKGDWIQDLCEEIERGTQTRKES